MRRHAVLLSAVLSAVLAAAALAQTQFVARWERPHPSWQPGPRGGGAMAYDSVRRMTLLYGGFGALPTLFGWNGSGWWQITTNSPPGPMNWPRLAFDAVRGRAVLVDTSGGNTWEWDGSSWIGTGVPLPASGAIAIPVVFHPGLGRVVAVTRAGLHAWDGLAWTTISSPGPATDALEVVHDPVRNVLVLRGWYDPISANETWEWNGTSWTSFGFQFAHGPIAATPALGVIALATLGGTGSPHVFRWDGAQWRAIDVADLGPSQAAMASWDSLRDRVVVFGSGAGDALFELTRNLARPPRTFTVASLTNPGDVINLAEGLRIALPGDRLVVLAGQQSQASGWRSRGIEIHFEAGALVPVETSLMFTDLPAGESIAVCGNGSSGGALFDAIHLMRCAGSVVLRDLRVESTELYRYGGLTAYRSARVRVQDCVVRRSWGELPSGGGIGSPLDGYESDLVLDGCTVQGGAAWVENPGTPFQAQRRAAPAVTLTDGRVFATRSTLDGGAGAVSVQGFGVAEATLIGASAAPSGRGGSVLMRATSDCTVPAGHATILPALPTLSVLSDATLGATASFTINGPPGAPAALFVAVTPALVVVPGIAMPLLLGSEAWPVASVVLSGGSATVIVPLPGVPALARALTYWQVLGIDGAGGMGLGNGRVVRLR